MSIAQSLSFKPRHLLQIQTGEFSGNWVPLVPDFKDPNLTSDVFAKEATQIEAEGGVVSLGDAPVALSLTLESIKNVLAALPSRP